MYIEEIKLSAVIMTSVYKVSRHKNAAPQGCDHYFVTYCHVVNFECNLAAYYW